MAISSNAYANYSANSDFTSPIIWSPTAEKFIYEQSVFQQFAINDPTHLNQPGRIGNYTLESGYSMGLLTEGVPTPISELSFSQVQIQFYGYGDAKQLTEEKLAQSFSYIIDDVRYGALGSMSENRDSVIVSGLMGSTATGVYPNGKTSGTIVSTDTFNTNMIADVETLMQESQGKVCEAIIIHPRQKNSLVKLVGFTDASDFSNRVISTGEIGSYLGIRILVSNHITSATENATTVYKAISLGRRPFIFAQKRQFEFNFERERMRDRAITVSWWEMFGIARLRDDSIRIMTSAGGL